MPSAHEGKHCVSYAIWCIMLAPCAQPVKTTSPTSLAAHRKQRGSRERVLTTQTSATAVPKVSACVSTRTGHGAQYTYGALVCEPADFCKGTRAARNYLGRYTYRGGPMTVDARGLTDDAHEDDANATRGRKARPQRTVWLLAVELLQHHGTQAKGSECSTRN